MAQRTQVVLVDDVDGGTADVTVAFAIDGTSYQIDLSNANAEKLRDAFAPWVGHARRLNRRGVAGRSSARSRGTATDIRRWAREQGHSISDRGRVPAEIRAAYEAAH